jgi:hypothetical protein
LRCTFAFSITKKKCLMIFDVAGFHLVFNGLLFYFSSDNYRNDYYFRLTGTFVPNLPNVAEINLAIDPLHPLYKNSFWLVWKIEDMQVPYVPYDSNPFSFHLTLENYTKSPIYFDILMSRVVDEIFIVNGQYINRDSIVPDIALIFSDSFYWLVLTNTIYLLAALSLIVQTIRFRLPYITWLWEIHDLTLLAFLSAIHHASKILITQNGNMIPEEKNITFAFVDDLFSLLVLTSVVTMHFRTNPNIPRWCHRTYQVSLKLVTIMLVLLYDVENGWMKSTLPIMVINGIALVGCIINSLQQHPLKQQKLRLLFLILAAISVIFARLMKSTPGNYVLYHSLWHFLSGLSIVFNVCAIAPPIRAITKKRNGLFPICLNIEC